MSQVTKRALEASLKHLLLQKPLNKITINDIAEDCGINRMTFYYHFKDIYDLVEWCCEEDASRALAGKKTYETWQQGLLQIFEAVQDNKPFILNVYRSVSREQVENYLYRITYDLLEGVVEEQAQGMSVRQEDKAFIATLYKYMFVGLMLDWIKSDMKGDPALIVERLEQVIHGSVSGFIKPGGMIKFYTVPRLVISFLSRGVFCRLFFFQKRGMLSPSKGKPTVARLPRSNVFREPAAEAESSKGEMIHVLFQRQL